MHKLKASTKVLDKNNTFSTNVQLSVIKYL